MSCKNKDHSQSSEQELVQVVPGVQEEPSHSQAAAANKGSKHATHMPPAFLGLMAGSMKNNEKKKAPKSIENSLKIDLWALLGTPLEPLWSLLGSILDTCGQKNGFLEALGRVLGAQDGQFGSNLEAEDSPKWRLERETIDVKRKHVFGTIFLSAWTSFWKGLWTIF